MCDFEKVNKTLPDKNDFYNSLSGKGISEKECQHIVKNLKKFEMKTMKDYHNLHLKGDVLLLANVF